jgi:hypothetical protein
MKNFLVTTAIACCACSSVPKQDPQPKESVNEVISAKGSSQALDVALDWLAMHQSKDGSWDSDGFNENCEKLGAWVAELGS